MKSIFYKPFPLTACILCTLILLSHFSFAQEEGQKKSKPEAKVFYAETTLETDDYKIYIIDAVATNRYSKFKLKVFNKTNDYLLIKPSEISYISGEKTIAATEENFVVAPNDESSRVLDFKGQDLQPDKFSVDLKGIYRVPVTGKKLEVPDFNLPASTNEFTSGNFTCSLEKNESSTSKTVSRFQCIYHGDAIGILNPSKSVLLMPNGTDNANAKRHKGTLLEKGQKEYFTLVFEEIAGAGDMQKSPLIIKWKETFKESKLVLLKGSKLEVIRDLSEK